VSAASPPAPMSAPALGSIDALKRVRAAEMEWDQKVKDAKEAAAQEIARLRADSDAAVKAAQSAADADRASKLQAARSEADREAVGILADGAKEAERATEGEGKHPADHTDDILRVVLSGFTSD
jgi:vacuolar-type H+-ATPase subunit H